MARLREWLDGQDGQDLVEYAMLLLLIAVAAMVAVGTLGRGVIDLFRSAAASYIVF
jgi:Flp pilus assembly pilin Flp